MKHVMVLLLAVGVAGSALAAQPAKDIKPNRGDAGELITCELTVAPQPHEALVFSTQSECDQAVGHLSLPSLVAAAQALRNAEQLRERSSPSMFTMTCKNIARQYHGTEAATRAEELAGSTK